MHCQLILIRIDAHFCGPKSAQHDPCQPSKSHQSPPDDCYTSATHALGVHVGKKGSAIRDASCAQVWAIATSPSHRLLHLATWWLHGARSAGTVPRSLPIREK